MSDTDEIVFSVVIPIYHGGEFLRKLVKSFSTLDFPMNKFEVIVAGTEDDLSSRKIVEAAISHEKFNISYITSSNSKKAVKLNHACTLAKGRFLFFVDDDCVLLPNSLKNLEKVIRNETNIGVIGGSDKLEATDITFELALDCVLNSFLGTGGLRKKTGVKVGQYYPKLWNMTVPNNVIADMNTGVKDGRLQVFRESITVYEDVDLVRRIEKSKKKIIFAPEVIVKHSRNTNLFSFVIRNIESVRISKSLGIYMFPQFILSVFVLWLLIGGILSFFYTSIQFIYLCSLILYVLLLLIASVQGGLKKKSIKTALFIPLLFFSLHFSKGFAHLIFWPTLEK